MDNESIQSPGKGMSPEEASRASSELNNLLQVIAGATAMLENKPAAEAAEAQAMLRESIQRAERLAAGLAWHAGGTSKRTLTRAEVADGEQGTGEQQASNAPKQTILVVDDEKMALTLMKHILTQAGFEVVLAQSGFECLEQFRLRPYAFALVLLDLTMPFMDGAETFARLKDIRPDIPVLLCTGFIQQDRLDRLMSTGLAGFLRKPVAPNEIIALVRQTLAEIRYGREKTQRGFSAAM
jgi:CheY-like chemotaxis protein